MVLLPPPWYFVASAIVLEIFIILFVLSTVRNHELFSKKKRRRRKMKKRLREKRWECCSLLYYSTRGIYTIYRGLGPALERGGVKPRTKWKMSKENAVVWTSHVYSSAKKRCNFWNSIVKTTRKSLTLSKIWWDIAGVLFKKRDGGVTRLAMNFVC